MSCLECDDFGMIATIADVPTLGQHVRAAGDDATDHRIGFNRPLTSSRQGEGSVACGPCVGR